MDWIKLANKKNKDLKKIMSFEDYMNMFEQDPKRELRPSFQYIKDMLQSFQSEKNNDLFSKNHHDAPPVFGQKRVQKKIYQNLVNFIEEGLNNKFLLLVGPNGSSKSSIVKKLMKGCEDYSRSKDGQLFTFSWIFPIDHFVKGTLGLGVNAPSKSIDTFAYLEDSEIAAILPNELKDHPILLVPEEFRTELIEKLLAEQPESLDMVKKSYLYRGDISKRNRLIYDSLLKTYHGDHARVLKHIRIERFDISKRYSSGAATIEPQQHVDARMQQITMDKRLASLPPGLQSLNLFSVQGEVILANRGILEFSDLLKRPLEAFKYLLTTMETSSINLSGIMVALDIFFIGTSNEVHLAAFKQHPDFNSFKGRFNFIRVPYLLDYLEEKNIYLQQINGLKESLKLEPHALTSLSLFSVMTRLRPCQSKNYGDTKISNIATKLSPLEKALLLSSENLPPEWIDSDEQQTLRHSILEIEKEFENENFYEGKFGLSPREVKKIIYQLSEKYEHITFVEVMEFLEALIHKKNEHDFLNMTAQGDFHHPPRFISLIKDHFLNIFDKELRDSLGIVDNRSYEQYITRYIQNINSLIKGEKIKNSITGKFENCDDFFIIEFEKGIALKENPETFRSSLISRLGAYSLDNKGHPLVYADIFPDIISRLKESFREEQKKIIIEISKNMIFFQSEFLAKKNGTTFNGSPLTRESRNHIQKILLILNEKFCYGQEGAISLIEYLIKNRYSD